MMAGMPATAEFPSLAAHFVWTPPLVWCAATLGIALVLWVLLRARGWGAAAGWLALAVAGQACAFQLLDVGPTIRLQLFRGWSELLHSWRIVFVLAIGLQAAAVAAGLWREWRRNASFRRGIAAIVSGPQALAFAAIAAFASITIAPEIAQAWVRGGFASKAILHATKIALGMAIFFGGAGSLALAAATLPPTLWARIAFRWELRRRGRIRWLAAKAVVLISAVLAWYPLAAMPHVPDEVAYLFQAKYISVGQVFLPSPPVPEAFPCRFTMIDDGRWYSAMLGGWTFLLALGIKLGVPWLVNPLLGGLAVLLGHAVMRRLYGEGAADGAALLLASSPWLLFMSANFMPHATSLVFFLLALLGVIRAREEGSLLWGAVAGLAFGGMLHIRPLEAVGAAGVAGLWWMAAGWKKLRLPALVAAGAAGTAVTLLLLAYNAALTGDPLYPPVNKYFDLTTAPGSNRLGFGKDIGNWGAGWRFLDALEGHGPIDVLMNTNHNLYLIHFELFGWASGSLLLLWWWLVQGRYRRDALMWSLLGGLWAAMSLYWFSGGPDFGARYWYLMIFPCVALTVRGASELAAKIREADPPASAAEAEVPSRVWAFVLLATMTGAANLVVWRALDKYPNYRGIRPDIRRLAKEHNFGRSLVLVRGPEWPDYHSAFVLNPPRLDRPAADGYEQPIFARDLGEPYNSRLRMYYSDRSVWIVAGARETGDTARLIAGPIAPGQPLPENEQAPAERRAERNTDHETRQPD